VKEKPVVQTPEDGKKVSKRASDVNTELTRRGIEALPEEELAKYDPKSVDNQIALISELLDEDYGLAKSMAFGETQIHASVSPDMLFNAVMSKAIDNNDVDTLKRLAKSPIATRLSIAAQKLRLSQEMRGKADVVADIVDVENIMMENAEKRVGKDKLKEQIEDDTKALQEAVKKAVKENSDAWVNFLKELECQ
jgi:hypothetical protein